MKLSLTLPGGLQVDFEGDQDEFKLVTDAFPALPDLMANAPSQVGRSPDTVRTTNGAASPDAEPESSPVAQTRTGIDVHALDERLLEVGATTDIERVTVMTQVVVESGLPAIDYPTAAKLFEDLGLRKPAKMRAAFQNAKTRGLLRSVGQGAWRPTVAGENFARYGRKPVKSRTTRAGSGAPLELTAGSEDQ